MQQIQRQAKHWFLSGIVVVMGLWLVPFYRAQAAPGRVLLGIYAPEWLGTQAAVDKHLRALDDWAGKRTSIAGTFIDFEDPNPSYNLPVPLELMFQNGYTAFVNFTSKRSAAAMARGDIDAAIKKMAKAYAAWLAQGTGRMAYLAPLPEMNGLSESYRGDTKNFKLAYMRIQRIFTEAGVPRESVRWVFAPNGWGQGHANDFENYYPGATAVDVVGFSAFNWGFYPSVRSKKWEEPAALFGSYLERMRRLAPGKPIFIAQTATTSYMLRGKAPAVKDQWLRDAYRYLAMQPAVRAVIYFNLDKECDWALFSEKVQCSGYKAAIADAAFEYVAPPELAQIDAVR
jgi:hypothetical protein